MRESLKKMLNKLGVPVVLQPYETYPVDFFDEEKGLNFTATVSLSGNQKHLIAEIQITQFVEGQEFPKFNQVFYMTAVHEKSDHYYATTMRVMGRPVNTGLHKGWYEKGCRFFNQCITHIRKGVMPDLDMLYQSIYGRVGGGSGGGYSGGSSSRSLKNDKPPPKPPMGKSGYMG